MRPCPVFASFTLAFALQLRKKHGKTSVIISKLEYYMLLEQNTVLIGNLLQMFLMEATVVKSSNMALVNSVYLSFILLGWVFKICARIMKKSVVRKERKKNMN